LRKEGENWNGTRITNTKAGTICNSVRTGFAANAASRPASCGGALRGGHANAVMRRIETAAAMVHKINRPIHIARGIKGWRTSALGAPVAMATEFTNPTLQMFRGFRRDFEASACPFAK
jgi:hypothetical protein